MNTLIHHVKNPFHGVHELAPVRRLAAQKQSLRILCWNTGYRLAGATDGLPIPPTRLIRLVAPLGEISWFLRGGKTGQECILYTLRRNVLNFTDFNAVLDFGCGCGRIMRHWYTMKGPRLYGTDYNPLLIDWCQKNLVSLAEFNINRLAPPLRYEDEQFDFIYAISVFTHLPQKLQADWFSELRRVLKTGGYLLITLHGQSRLNHLSADEQAKFLSGQMIIREEGQAGTNVCGSYHPESYVRSSLGESFTIVDFMDAGARDINQDIYLLRK